MRRYKIFGLCAAAGFASLAAGCDMDLTEVNQNPNNPEVVPVESVLSSGIWDLVSPSTGYGVFGEWTTMFHTSLWSQHLAQSNYIREDNYQPREGINQNIWESMYAGALQDLQRTKEIAVEEGDENLAAVAEILQVYGFTFLTDAFGDIPYFEALDLENSQSPEFTPQSEIYPDLLARLEAAAAQIDPAANATWDAGDLIYDGDLERWQEFANSLRLRLAVRTAGTSFAGQAAQEFADAWSSNRFDSNADNADLDWTGTLPMQNPNYENLILGGRYGEFRVSKTLVDVLEALDDPRLAVYADPAEFDGEYRGLRNGASPQQAGGTAGVADYSGIGSRFVQADAPSVLMPYAEVLLLGAEAAERGWIADDAAELLAEGIRASMDSYGISDAAIDAYLAQPEFANPTLEDIHLQQWIAVYMIGTEPFAYVRRTGIPDLPLPFAPVIDQVPTRLPYPVNEGLYNPNFEPYENVEYTDPIWWMQ